VIALESYIGLVEAGVGLIPAGGGCKEFAIRACAARDAKTGGNDPFEFIQPVFMTIAMATVSKSGAQARELGYAARYRQDRLQRQRAALCRAARSARAGRSRLLPEAVAAQHQGGGRTGIANCEMMLANMKEGGMISAHDYLVAKRGDRLCGGDVETGSLVDEEWLLTVERKLFVELLKNEKTQQRIAAHAGNRQAAA
jgi:3-hydroxyacyl-CoA dehydrogenase